MKRLVLIGGGGHGRSVLDAASGQYEDIVILDPHIPAGTWVSGAVVRGDDSCMEQLFAEGYHDAAIGVGSIGSTSLRRKLTERAERAGFNFPSIIDNSAAVAADAKLGRGVFVGKNAVVNANAQVEDMAIINSGAVVEHDCAVGAYAHVSVGAVVCGSAVIGRDTFIGANATVIQGVNIGNEAIIGAGMLVLRDVTDGKKVIGLRGGIASKYSSYSMPPRRAVKIA